MSRAEATTVCVAADHTLMDGYSVFQIPYEIHTLYAAARAAEGSVLPLPPAPSYLDFAEAERTAADALTAQHPAIVCWQRFVSAGGGRLPPFPVTVSNADGGADAQPGGYIELLDASAARAFERVCRDAGGDSFSGLLACFARASREIAGSHEFRTMVPFHTHTGARRSSIGWYVGMGPVAFPFEAADAFDEAVRSAVAGLKGVKELAQVPMSRVMELLGQPLRDPFMISYMDLRLVAGARNWARWQTVALRSRSMDPDEVCLWIMRTHNGLCISYRYPANDLAGVVVPRYVARTKHLLACVARTTHWPPPPSTQQERNVHDGHQTHCSSMS
ncbi:condensation domain-containing protein [Xanthomonas theicola]|uniref:condensation domain-containing protein n=1 Tax=Xanthomonas theicola TaxID=56464 RepID=UPI002483D6D7|nr:condensation domain-containing protein [Xanthomonas theicola]